MIFSYEICFRWYNFCILAKTTVFGRFGGALIFTKSCILFQHVAVDVDGLSTFDLVWLARGSLDRGDLDQAVRYVSMLK